MVDQIAIVSVTINSGTSGTVAFTHASITEPFKCAIFLYGGNSSDSTNNDHFVIGMGACSIEGTGDAGKNISYCTQGTNASVGTPDYNTSRFQSRAAHIVSGTNVNSTVFNMKINSATPGGVLMDIVTSTQTVKITAILFAGIAHSGVARPTITGASSANVDVGDTPNFRPQVLLSFGGGSAFGTDSGDAIPSLGFAVDTSPIKQVAAFVSVDDQTEPTDGDGEVATAKWMMNMPGALSARTATRGAITSFDSQGYNWSTDGTLAAAAMALRFTDAVQISCVVETVAATTGAQTFNGFGFTPDLVIGMATLMGSSDTPIDGATAASAGLFVTGAFGSRAITAHAEENKTNGSNAPFNTHHRAEDVALLLYASAGATGTIVQRATWAGGSGSGGYILDFSTADSAGRFVALGIKFPQDFPFVDADEQISEQVGRHVAKLAGETEEIVESVGAAVTLAIFGGTAQDDGNQTVANP